MKSIYQQIWCIGFLLEGIFCGHMQPRLRPLMYASCPNEIAAYTCHDSQVKIIKWIMEPYVPESDPIIFAASITVTPEGRAPLSRTPVLAILTSVMNRRGNNVSGWMADMTTALIVNTAEVENKTNITCQTQKGINFLSHSTILYIAGVPYQNNVQITYQLQDTHYTAVVQLADMFDGGGVQIHHYNIQLDNGTLLRTPGPTYSVDVTYNVAVFMNISAYSCAGYSDPFILEISKENAPGNESDVLRPTALSVAVAVTVVVGIIILIIITALLILFVYRRIGHTCYDHVRPLNAENVLNETGIHHVQTYPPPDPHSTVNRPGSPLSPPVDELEYHMDNNPLYVGVKPMAGLSTEKPHEYETCY